MQEHDAIPAPASPVPTTDQRPVSALGWGLALGGGALLWAALIALWWR